MSAVIDVAREPILIKKIEQGIARLTLNRPDQYNPLSREMLTELQRALDEIAEDESISVVILSGNGKAFSAGHDLKEMRSRDDRLFHQELFQQCAQVMQAIAKLPQPVIAQVDGIATAAGCQLVAQCDLVVASEASRFAVSGINLGLFCSAPAVPLSRAVLPKHALRMLLTGDFIDAQTAFQYGLVSDVVPTEDIENETQALAEKIAAKLPLAIRAGKAMFYRQLEMPLDKAYELAGETMACNMDSEEAREGFDAFLEKRQPSWKGR